MKKVFKGFKRNASSNEKEFIYKEELKDELKNNSIVLSFALSIIIVGIFSIFYTTNKISFYICLFAKVFQFKTLAFCF